MHDVEAARAESQIGGFRVDDHLISLSDLADEPDVRPRRPVLVADPYGQGVG